MSVNWYVVHSKPRQEQVAELNLIRQGYECYLPLVKVERLQRKTMRVSEEAMFPRYLFIRLDDSDQGKSWLPIRSTIGVSNLVKFGFQAAKVSDSLIDYLKEKDKEQITLSLYQPGDKVIISEGAFAGIEAVYHTYDAEKRAIIFLDFLGKQTQMKISPTAIYKI